jgi:hypothetical protein
VSGAPAPAAAGSGQSLTLPAGVQRYVAIRAVDEQGNIGLPAMTEANGGAPLPSLGRCVRATGRTGEYRDGRCLKEAGGKGVYSWLPGPGADARFSGELGATTLETVGAKKLVCSSGSDQGEYTGASSELLTLALHGCERLETHHACQSPGAAAGEVMASGLEGELGFIRAGAKPIVGLDLRHTVDLASVECGASGAPGKELILIEGSVIATVGKLDTMTATFTDAFAADGGRQRVRAFEGGVEDTPAATFISGLERTTEAAGLEATATQRSEEPLEIKAKV